MMKFVIAAVALMFAFPSSAQDVKSLFADINVSDISQINTNSENTLKFRVKHSGQAANLVNPDVELVYQQAISKFSQLKKAVADLYDGYGCNTDGEYKDNPGLPCGELSPAKPQNTVLWSFSRAGWEKANATLVSILTYTRDGTASVTNAVLMLTWTVQVRALNLASDEDSAFEVTVRLASIQNIPDPPSDDPGQNQSSKEVYR